MSRRDFQWGNPVNYVSSPHESLMLGSHCTYYMHIGSLLCMKVASLALLVVAIQHRTLLTQIMVWASGWHGKMYLCESCWLRSLKGGDRRKERRQCSNAGPTFAVSWSFKVKHGLGFFSCSPPSSCVVSNFHKLHTSTCTHDKTDIAEQVRHHCVDFLNGENQNLSFSLDRYHE